MGEKKQFLLSFFKIIHSAVYNHPQGFFLAPPGNGWHVFCHSVSALRRRIANGRSACVFRACVVRLPMLDAAVFDRKAPDRITPYLAGYSFSGNGIPKTRFFENGGV